MGAVDTSASPGARNREFAFAHEDFVALRDLVRTYTGIHLSDQKRELVYGRLSRRLRALGLHTFREYRELLERSPDSELVHFRNAVTTNLTFFFREGHHFQYLRDAAIELVTSRPPSRRRLRIWSAACSSGEEPYSIAMTLGEAFGEQLKEWDVRILATDIDTEMLDRAQAGVYGAKRVPELSAARLERFFTRTANSSGAAYAIKEDLRRLILFKQLNLMEAFPMKGPLDVIFCRNVIIYFDKATQRELFKRIARLQPAGALLFLGHSETLFKVSDDYALIGKTIYRRR
jgi:chemotaxis protein methyltransferase CheR